jgi:hypothetical protein
MPSTSQAMPPRRRRGYAGGPHTTVRRGTSRAGDSWSRRGAATLRLRHRVLPPHAHDGARRSPARSHDLARVLTAPDRRLWDEAGDEAGGRRSAWSERRGNEQAFMPIEPLPLRIASWLASSDMAVRRRRHVPEAISVITRWGCGRMLLGHAARKTQPPFCRGVCDERASLPADPGRTCLAPRVSASQPAERRSGSGPDSHRRGTTGTRRPGQVREVASRPRSSAGEADRLLRLPKQLGRDVFDMPLRLDDQRADP